MSCDMWAYEPDKCDGQPCPGDCDFCSRAEDWEDDEDDEDIQAENLRSVLKGIHPERR